MLYLNYIVYECDFKLQKCKNVSDVLHTICYALI